MQSELLWLHKGAQDAVSLRTLSQLLGVDLFEFTQHYPPTWGADAQVIYGVGQSEPEE